MEREKLLLGLIDRLLGSSESSLEVREKPHVGKYVIVRCRDAGVHAGVLVDYENRNVELSESRRLWYFKCRTGHSLSGVALYGLTNESKIAGELPSIVLSDACEIIPVSEESERSIRDAEEYNT